jgi:ubiquitin-protein ligase E3 C
LATLDPELYNGLIFLKNYTGNIEADLSLNFTINDDGALRLQILESSH